MHSRTMFWISILFVVSFSGQVYTLVDVCPSKWFQNNGICKQCPDNCMSCVSNTDCSTCKDNYYGPTCQNKCRPECNGICHKEYGHCTHRCKDGTYIIKENVTCKVCPTNCLICSSELSCFACARGFGDFCQIRCPDACLDGRCNKHNGECFQCKEGYFRSDEGCRRCTDGCAQCNDTGNCSECQNGFYGPIDRRCISECETEVPSRQFLARRDDKCGISLQHTIDNTETCQNILEDQNYECLIESYCMNYTACAADHRCSSSGNVDVKDDVCAMVMSEVCRTKCSLPVSSTQGSSWNHRCSQTCTTEVPEKHPQGSLCFRGNKLVDVNGSNAHDFIHKIAARCSQDTPKSECDVFKIVVLVESIVLVIVIVVMVLLVHAVATRRRDIRRRYRDSESQREQDVPPEVAAGHYAAIGTIPNHGQAACSADRYDHFSGPLERNDGTCSLSEQSRGSITEHDGATSGEQFEMIRIPASDEHNASDKEPADLAVSEWAQQEYTDCYSAKL